MGLVGDNMYIDLAKVDEKGIVIDDIVSFGEEYIKNTAIQKLENVKLTTPIPTKGSMVLKLILKCCTPIFKRMGIINKADTTARMETICMEVKPWAASVLTNKPIRPQNTALAMIYK